jgi:hypothetical protein
LAVSLQSAQHVGPLALRQCGLGTGASLSSQCHV